MSASSAALGGRLAAERMMTDTLRVRRVTGTSTNTTTGVDTPTYSTLYNSVGRIQTYQPFESTPAAGGATYTVQRYAAHFPVASFNAKVDDVIDVQAAPNDSDAVGRVYRVAGLLHKTNATAMRLLVDEVVV